MPPDVIPASEPEVIAVRVSASGQKFVFEELTPEDLAAIEATQHEPLIPFEDVLKKHPELVSRFSPKG